MLHNLVVTNQTEVVMQKCAARILAAQSAVVLLAVALSCGGSNRQLQSITATASGMTQFQFTATGVFSTSPASVSPLPVFWWAGPALLNPPFVYTLSSQPYNIACQTGDSVIAIAPISPNAPVSGSIPTQVFEQLVVTQTGTAEGGFVASAPQSISCP
jgi:hypothetical protein